jgi:hypothetical protein
MHFICLSCFLVSPLCSFCLFLLLCFSVCFFQSVSPLWSLPHCPSFAILCLYILHLFIPSVSSLLSLSFSLSYFVSLSLSLFPFYIFYSASYPLFSHVFFSLLQSLSSNSAFTPPPSLTLTKCNGGSSDGWRGSGIGGGGRGGGRGEKATGIPLP